MLVYTMRRCEDCERHYAVFWRAWTGEFVFCHPHTLTEITARSASDECVNCGGILRVVLPCAVRTTEGDWLALPSAQTMRALAN